MSRVSRDSPGGRAYLDLQNHARREHRSSQDLMILYAVERWLARMARSAYSEHFILKGGMLLAAIDRRRPTVDADALFRGISDDADTVAAIIKEVAALPDPYDGVDFDTSRLRMWTIREEGVYAGFRAVFSARLASALIKVSLDINFGDPVTPEPRWVDLPSVRPGGSSVRVLGYPLETVLSEKIATAMELAAVNTRMKDYADVWTLSGRHGFDHDTLRAALISTTDFRRSRLEPLTQGVAELVLRQARTYSAYRTSLASDGAHLPLNLDEVAADVAAFADHLLDEAPVATVWDATSRSWG